MVDGDKLAEVADVFIDPNTLSVDGTASISQDEIEFSRNGRYMGYMVKLKGSDWSTGYVRDTISKKDLP